MAAKQLYCLIKLNKKTPHQSAIAAVRRIKLPPSFLLFYFHPEPNGSGVALPGEGTPKLVVVIQRPFQVPSGGVGDLGLVAHEGDDLAVGRDGQHGPDVAVWVTQLRAPLRRAGVGVVV